MSERVSPEEARKDLWLRELAEFIVEANTETWAVDAGEIPIEQVERKGYCLPKDYLIIC